MTRVLQDERGDLRLAGFIPQNPTLSGYIAGWRTSTLCTFGRFFWNTFLIILPKTVFTVISHAAVAYGFARFDFPGKKILIASLLLPNGVTRIPQYLLFSGMGWLDTFLPLWLPSAFAGDAFFVFMPVQFLRSIPRDMEEAARVDGAKSWQVLLFIVVPMLTPAPISVALFQFMWTLSDFLRTLIYLSSVNRFPVSLALRLPLAAIRDAILFGLEIIPKRADRRAAGRHHRRQPRPADGHGPRGGKTDRPARPGTRSGCVQRKACTPASGPPPSQLPVGLRRRIVDHDGPFDMDAVLPREGRVRPEALPIRIAPPGRLRNPSLGAERAAGVRGAGAGRTGWAEDGQ
ncbi:carbohydrate ABC transporter permease, partial [Paracoccus shandongensis]|uniref:carbohydrate ABC transporter permease n=1 Tax=Paracoccus shandongensis TaxID=2816048 RepID=UPI003013C534